MYQLTAQRVFLGLYADSGRTGITGHEYTKNRATPIATRAWPIGFWHTGRYTPDMARLRPQDRP